MSRYEGNNKAHLRPKDYDKYGDVILDDVSEVTDYSGYPTVEPTESVKEDKAVRSIDANALKEQIDYYIKEAGWSEHDNRVLGWCKEFIDNAPTIKTFTLLDIEEQYRKGLEKGLSEWETERPQGEWIELRSYDYKCSICGDSFMDKSNFCPNCGAYMCKKEGDEE